MLHAEALVFGSERPLNAKEISDMVSSALQTELTEEQVLDMLILISKKYASDAFPFHLVESGGGWQFLTKGLYHGTVLQLNKEKHIKKLSAAALETLSIIAYKQPVTKGDVEFIRGVSADYAIQKLLDKDLIVISGRAENVVGKPLLYQTSKNFMDYLGINHKNELPQLKDISDVEIVTPTSGAEAEV